MRLLFKIKGYEEVTVKLKEGDRSKGHEEVIVK